MTLSRTQKGALIGAAVTSEAVRNSTSFDTELRRHRSVPEMRELVNAAARGDRPVVRMAQAPAETDSYAVRARTSRTPASYAQTFVLLREQIGFRYVELERNTNRQDIVATRDRLAADGRLVKVSVTL